jgi:hypothetical protein
MADADAASTGTMKTSTIHDDSPTVRANRA